MKTKVIAFRVTQDEYRALVELCDSKGNISFSKLFGDEIRQKLLEAEELLKRRERAFKAKKKRDAKKAADAAQ